MNYSFISSGAAPVLNSNNDSIIYGEIGQNVILTCETANENDTLAWYFNNVPLSTESQVRGTYTLSPLQVGDGGWYTCAAANRFGRDEKDFLLVAGGKYMHPSRIVYELKYLLQFKRCVCVCACVCKEHRHMVPRLENWSSTVESALC